MRTGTWSTRRDDARLRQLVFAGTLLLILLISAGVASDKAFSQSGEPEQTDETSTYVPGQLVVGLEDWVPQTTIDEVLRPVNDATGARTVDDIPASGMALVDLPPGLTVEEARRLYEEAYGVEFAEPNHRLQPQAVPNDPHFGKLWGLHNTGQTGGLADADIDAPEAWGAVTGSSSVVVAVIDSGVDVTHPDLSNLWLNADEVAGNGVDDDANGYVDDVQGWDFQNNNASVEDDLGHGTHVTGTIAARSNNGTGVTGVASGVRIMPLKISNSFGANYDAARALDYAVANGAMISNNSYGCLPSSTNTCQGHDVLARAVERAQAAGHLFVAAAGNGNPDRIGDDIDVQGQHVYPAGLPYSNIVSVAATDHTDDLTPYSNYGAASVDLAAPGGTEDTQAAGIYSTVPVTSQNPTGYAYDSGTSMATPHVVGAAALLKSLYPNYGYAAIKQRLLDSVDVKPGLQGKTVAGGRLNVARAIGEYGAPLVTQTTPADGATKVPEGSNVTATFSEPMDPATLNATTFALTTSGGSPVAATVTYNATAKRATLDPTSNLAPGAVYEARIKGGSPGARDVSGDPLSADRIWSFTVDPPPRVVATSPYPGETGASRYTKVEVFFSEDVDPGTVTWDRFGLRENLSGVQVPIRSVSYDPAAKKATVYLQGSIQAGKGYMAKARGGTYGVRDRTGNVLVQSGYGDRSYWRDDWYNWYFDG